MRKRNMLLIAIGLLLLVCTPVSAEEEDIAWCEMPQEGEVESEVMEVDACTYIVDLQEKLDCCDQLYYDTLDGCIEDLTSFIAWYCVLPPDWCRNNQGVGSCNIDPWLTGQYGVCVSYHWYTGVFYCGEQSNNAYISCINN